MTAVAFQLPPLDQVEAEEKDELAGVLGFVLTPSTSDAQLDAYASDVMRVLGEYQTDLKRYQEAWKAEVLRVGMRYTPRVERLAKQIAQLEEIGKDIAKRAKFPGKSKSRSTAYGTYGSRSASERIAIADHQKAIVSIAKLNPTLVHSVPEIKLADVKDVVFAHLRETGEILDGFEHIPESETFFVKADV